MAEIFLCTISKINYKAGTADLAIPEKEDMVRTDVPFLSSYYEMPSPGETVAAVFEKKNGKLTRGVILGGIFSANHLPAASGQGIFYKQFADGAYVRYDSVSATMEVGAKNLTVQNLSAGKITYSESCEKG